MMALTCCQWWIYLIKAQSTLMQSAVKNDQEGIRVHQLHRYHSNVSMHAYALLPSHEHSILASDVSKARP